MKAAFIHELSQCALEHVSCAFPMWFINARRINRISLQLRMPTQEGYRLPHKSTNVFSLSPCIEDVWHKAVVNRKHARQRMCECCTQPRMSICEIFCRVQVPRSCHESQMMTGVSFFNLSVRLFLCVCLRAYGHTLLSTM